MRVLILGVALLSVTLGELARRAQLVGDVLFAQTLPVTLNFAWTANDPSQNVTSYSLFQDGVLCVSPVTTAGSCSVTVAGLHVFTVSATNSFGTSPLSAPLPFFVGVPTVVVGLHRTP